MNNSIHTERRLNTRSKIYNTLYNSKKPLSKLDIAKELALSMPTVYQNINELMEMGLIRYSGLRPSSGGRPAMNLEIVTTARYAIGISIQSGRISFAAINLKCEELSYKRIHFSEPLMSDRYIDFLCRELEKFIDESKTDRKRLLGIGISVPGIIGDDSSTILYAPALGARNLSMLPLIDAIPYPVHLENDANSAGFAEVSASDIHGGLAYLSLADGVGGTVFVNDALHRGNNFRSGEFGHMSVEYGGRLCACGKRGCLEAYCSEYRILEDSGLSLEKFFANLAEGDEKAAEIWEDYLRHLATGIHNIRMALDCKIVLGGIMAYYLIPYFSKLESYVFELDPFGPDQDYLRISENPLHSTVLGGAMYFVKGFLEANCY